jgi:hypothetical protein
LIAERRRSAVKRDQSAATAAIIISFGFTDAPTATVNGLRHLRNLPDEGFEPDHGADRQAVMHLYLRRDVNTQS